MTPRPVGALAMEPSALAPVITPRVAAELTALLAVETTHVLDERTLAAPEAAAIEVLITGWGAPAITPDVLSRMPSLRAILHWGGAVDFVSAEAWDRGIRVTSAGWANAIPVAEFTLALITLAAKDAFWASRLYASEQRFVHRERELPRIGLAGRTIGIVGASQIGSRVIDGLRGHDVEVLLFDPVCSPDRAAQLGATLVEELDEVAARSSILSLHAPVLAATRGMVSRAVLGSMPDGATLINTARGALVDQDALVDELSAGRLRAVLDVTEPDVLPAGHPLYTMPTAFLTPHLAGSAGTELERLGRAVVDEVERFVRDEPAYFPVPRPFG